MTAHAFEPNELPARRRTAVISRRALLLGATGMTALLGSGTATYAAIEAARALRITRYRLAPKAWPVGRRLSISVIADLHAGGPNMGLDRIRQVVDVTNLLRSDLVVLLGDYFASHHFITEVVPPQA